MEEWLSAAARARPGHPALVAEGRSIAYGELEEMAVEAAGRLAGSGVRPGQRVEVLARPGIEFAALLHALARLGVSIVPLRDRGLRGVPASEEAGVPLRDRVDPAETHSVIFTSGTTGEPQPVELTYANHHVSAMASAELLGVDPDDRWLCVLPLHHVGGLAILLRSAIYGTAAVLHERFEAERVKDELERGEVTLVSLVPTMLARLRAAGLREAPRLRAILLGGGPIPPELLRWAWDAGLPVRPTYGMTEAASQIATGRPGEAGARPLPGVEVRIADRGEILVRGPMVSAGALAEDGWLHTGDRGRLDSEGRLHVEGRLKELIVTGGENVSPREVEEVLTAHPAVRDAGVVGLPDPEWGEAVSAFVVLDAAATAEELLAWCRERLAPYAVPKRIEQVPGLPRTPAGELLRDELAP